MLVRSRALALGLLASLTACSGASGGRAPAASAPTWNEAAQARYAGIEESPIVLSDGAWDGEPFDPDGFARPHVVLLDDFWLAGDLDSDLAPEAVVLLAASSGAAGTDLYVAALARRGGSVVEASTALVGNRVQVRSARIEDARIVLEVVQAGPNDAMCCPGEKATRAFAFEGEALVEVESRVTGRLVPGDLSGVEWVLVKIGDDPAPAAPEVTLRFDGARVSGNAGCNSLFGEVRAGSRPGELALGPLGATKMACAEPAMSLESRFLDALGRATRFGFVAGQLVLVSAADGRIEELWFRAREAAK
jgi:heat shock protein HslJ